MVKNGSKVDYPSENPGNNNFAKNLKKELGSSNIYSSLFCLGMNRESACYFVAKHGVVVLTRTLGINYVLV